MTDYRLNELLDTYLNDITEYHRVTITTGIAAGSLYRRTEVRVFKDERRAIEEVRYQAECYPEGTYVCRLTAKRLTGREARAIAALYRWCERNYTKGADPMVECWGTADFLATYLEAGNLRDAKRLLRNIASVYGDRQADARNSAF